MIAKIKKIFWKIRLKKLSKSISHKNFQSDICFIFFANEAGIGSFYETHIKVAKLIAEIGAKARLLGCLSQFPRCGVHLLSRGLKTDKRAEDSDCFRCMRRAVQKHPRQAELFTKTIHRSKLNPIARKKIRELALLNTLKVRACIPGGISKYQRTPEFQSLENSGRIAYGQAKDAMADRGGNVFVHVNNYYLSLSGRVAAEELQVRSLCLAHGSLKNNSPENILVNQRHELLEMREPAKKWRKLKEYPIPERMIHLVYEDLLIRLGSKGTHTWSPVLKTGPSSLPKEIQKDVCKNEPILLAFTSSQDERQFEEIIRNSFKLGRPAENSIFPDQNSWLTHLAGWSRRNGAMLWIRIHPRNRLFERPCLVAQTARDLAETYSNVRCIEANDPISTYNLMEFADLGVYGWSSMGLESACLGLPVISYQKEFCLYPPESVGPQVTGLKNYENNLLVAVRKRGVSDVISAWRVAALVHLGNAIHDRPDYLRNLSNKKLMQAIFLKGESPLKFYEDELNHGKLSYVQEKAEIEKRMQSLLAVFFSGPTNHSSGQIFKTLDANKKNESTSVQQFLFRDLGKNSLAPSKGVKRIQAFLKGLSEN